MSKSLISPCFVRVNIESRCRIVVPTFTDRILRKLRDTSKAYNYICLQTIMNLLYTKKILMYTCSHMPGLQQTNSFYFQVVAADADLLEAGSSSSPASVTCSAAWFSVAASSSVATATWAVPSAVSLEPLLAVGCQQ
jgi:hypothetical protein